MCVKSDTTASLVIWSVTEVKCGWKESSAAQSTSTGGGVKLQRVNHDERLCGTAEYLCRDMQQVSRRCYLPQLRTFHLTQYDTWHGLRPHGFFQFATNIHVARWSIWAASIFRSINRTRRVASLRVASRRGDYEHGYPVNHSVARSPHISATCPAAQAA
jgi:hypothetical protein